MYVHCTVNGQEEIPSSVVLQKENLEKTWNQWLVLVIPVISASLIQSWCTMFLLSLSISGTVLRPGVFRKVVISPIKKQFGKRHFAFLCYVEKLCEPSWWYQHQT